LTMWPACALPSAPGTVLMVPDPPNEAGDVRVACDGAYGESEAPGEHGDLALEGLGRQKLLVTLPEEGGIAVLGAQRLLDRPVGSFDPCPVEVWLPLQVELPSSYVPERPVENDTCVNPAPVTPGAPPAFHARPGGIAVTKDRFYIADLDAPVIHVI